MAEDGLLEQRWMALLLANLLDGVASSEVDVAKATRLTSSIYGLWRSNAAILQ